MKEPHIAVIQAMLRESKSLYVEKIIFIILVAYVSFLPIDEIRLILSILLYDTVNGPSSGEVGIWSVGMDIQLISIGRFK